MAVLLVAASHYEGVTGHQADFSDQIRWKVQASVNLKRNYRRRKIQCFPLAKACIILPIFGLIH